MTDGMVRARRTDFYNDPEFNYAQFWVGRDYEHQAEVMALRRLLHGQRFDRAIDIGGGYGRLSVILGEYADHVTLADPSSQQLDLSARIFPNLPRLDRVLADATHLQFKDHSVDLVALIRVLHHLPDPAPEFAELSRILRPGGYAVIEVANSVHAMRRISGLLTGRRGSAEPVDIRSEESRQRGTAPYFNHHPRTITRQLDALGLQVCRVLSVSNLRHPAAKALLPLRAMLSIERLAQRPLGKLYFGPSMFFLLRKKAPLPGRSGAGVSAEEP
jgi:ubiquinone/menaquinone biosynthesis C-methylase UbiE